MSRERKTVYSHSIPKNDRKILEKHFKDFIYWSDFAYPLLGDKPMSFDADRDPHYFDAFWEALERN